MIGDISVLAQTSFHPPSSHTVKITSRNKGQIKLFVLFDNSFRLDKAEYEACQDIDGIIIIPKGVIKVAKKGVLVVGWFLKFEF